MWGFVGFGGLWSRESEELWGLEACEGWLRFEGERYGEGCGAEMR